MTVVVLEQSTPSAWKIPDREIETFVTKDGRPGGQHRNKTESCVVMRHLPTGIEAKASSKSQHRNREDARGVPEARVREHHERLAKAGRDSHRREQAGSGMRGDKIRTYRVRDDLVTDHRRDRKARLTRLMAGCLEDLGALSA